ncbi:MAG: Clp protease N-terminal domain-containing protein [Acidimicrobiia bacterium]
MTDLPDLDRLIAAVNDEALTDQPLDRLAAAARARDELDELTEALLDHFVDEARQAGCSWSQIGSALGVSKQAAQQRHTAVDSVSRLLLSRLAKERRPGRKGGLFRRFTPRARACVVSAQDAARHLGHNYIGTEHVLLALFAEPDSIAAKGLAEMGVTGEEVQAAVIEMIGRGSDTVKGHIPFTPRAKKVLELSLREALALGHNYIGTEHILLGLTREEKGVAGTVLAARDVDHDRAREVMLRILGVAT